MMKPILFTFLIFLSLTVSCAQQSEEKLVRNSWENYKSAILNDQGEEATKYVDSRTINYYDQILKLARTADSTTVESLPVFDKLMVFALRNRSDSDSVRNLDGRSLLLHDMNNGLLGKNTISDFSLGDITVNKFFAKGQLIIRMEETPLDFQFHKEEGQWKVHLTSLFPMIVSAFEQRIEKSGQNTNEYLFLNTGK